MSIRGVVSKLSSNEYNGKTLWSFRLRGDNNYYNTGDRVPPVTEGQSVEFTTRLSPSGKHQVQIDTIRPWEGGPSMEGVQISKFAAKPSGKSAEEKGYWEAKQARDVRNDHLRELGATRNTAIAFLNLLITSGSLKLPAAEAKREGVLWDALNHYTDKLMKGEEIKAPTEESKPEPVATADGDDWG